ncbi:MAG: acetyltransferase [Candidatus Hydrogenedentes bacterium]|nr:acetyltransferase [Candidatus Hydrogenedentota bacterium]
MSNTMIILGACGTSRELYVRLMERYPFTRVVFVDDQSDICEIKMGDTVLPVIKDWDFSKVRDGHDDDFRQFVCGPGDPRVKKLLVARALDAKLEPSPTIVDSSAVVHAESIGRGGFIGPQCVVSPQVQIGDYVTLIGLIGIGHDTVLEDYVTCTPGVVIAGSCHVGKGSYFGIGSMVHHQLTLAPGTVAGAQSCLLKDVTDPNSVMVGTPAKKV